MRVLLIAKPWKGGLARYLFEALLEHPRIDAQWIETAPASARERWQYRSDRENWRNRRIDAINEASRDAAIFINLPRFATNIAHHSGNLLWMTDDARASAAQLEPFAGIFASDPGHAKRLAKHAGDNRFAGVLPFAMSPRIHQNTGHRAPLRDVCFIGNRDPKRDPHIAALLRLPNSATVVGNYFLRSAEFWRAPRHFRPRVPIEAMARIYARHRISLNVHAQVLAEGTNMRTFECAGYAIPQLVENRPGLAKLFEPNREIVTYGEPQELAEAISNLLADPEKAAAMANRARQRALQEHTYAHRVAQMLAALP